ncbi:MAG: succinate--CoA ligase subunit alpha [Burkholderiales bacterium]|nr:succinate--CoA ligase subunit alpha [Burkholderiales bacterium]
MISPRIDRSTRVILQGISGRAGRLHSRLMREYGTNIVAGVSPPKDINEINGIPLFPDCASAVKATGATVSVALVGAYDLLEAMREAVAAGIKMIVTPTEGMPVHDALKAKRLTQQAGVLWIGGSTPGMAVAEVAKLGFLPDVSLKSGALGLMSKSGTLSYEAGFRLAQGGIGTSVWIGVGGDPVKGVRYSDLVPFYAQDKQTRGVLIIGEIGGRDEEDFADALKTHAFAKPVFALIAGRTAPEGVSMGHAGALTYGNHGGYASKRAALENAGVRVFSSLNEMAEKIADVF